MLLSEARTRLSKALDDSVSRYDSTEIDDALKSAQGEAWTAALGGSGRRYFKLTATPTSSSAGVVDLSTQLPRKLLSVSYMQSLMRLVVMPVRMEAAPVSYKYAAPLEVIYLPDVSFPAAANDPFVWGSASAMPSLITQLDALMVLIAIAELKPKESEKPVGLAERIDAKKQAIEDAIPASSWTSIPLDGAAGQRQGRRRAPFGYIETGPHTLQLVLV